MAIQMRRGLKKDFDPNKMLPGEWAVSIDSTTSNQIVWMCFAAGVCKRMGTYEDFQSMVNEISADIIAQYKAEFNVILSEVKSIADAVESDKESVVTMHTQIKNEYLPQIAKAYDDAMLSKSYAVGGTGTRDGEDTDNAKYYSKQAKESAKKAEEVAGIGYAETGTKAGLVKPMDIHVDSTDGAMRMTATTTDTTLTNSYAGGLSVNEIGGVSVQDGEPTPEAPVDIESVVIKDIKVTGAQLYDITNYPLTDGMWINSTNGLQSANGAYASTPYIPCKHLQGMTLTLNKRPGGALPGIAFYLEQKKDAFISGVANANETAGQPITFTVPVDAVYMQFTVPSGATEIMLNEGAESLSYEPYTEKSVTLSNPITLNGIGDVQDRIVKKDGAYGVERRFAEVVFDGSDDEVITYKATSSSPAGGYAQIVLPLEAKPCSHPDIPNLMTSCFMTVTNSYAAFTEGTSSISSTGERISIASKKFTDADTVRAWLLENPITVLYELAEPTFEPLPEADQIALHSLVTFDTVTHISTDSKVEPTWDVEYGTSKVGALALENANRHSTMANKTSARRFVLLGDSNSTPADYNNNMTALYMLRDYLDSIAGYSVSNITAISGYGYATGNFASLLPADSEVTDIVVCGGGNDAEKEYSVISESISAFIESAKSMYPKLKDIYMVYHASTLNIAVNTYNKSKVLMAMQDVANTIRGINIHINDISMNASDVNLTFSVDDRHYNEYGQKCLFMPLKCAVMGEQYINPLHIIKLTAEDIELTKANESDTMTLDENSYILFYPDGTMNFSISFTGTVSSAFWLRFPTHYLRKNYHDGNWAMYLAIAKDTGDINNILVSNFNIVNTAHDYSTMNFFVTGGSYTPTGIARMMGTVHSNSIR